MKNEILAKHYWDVSQPGSLSGSENFYRALKSKNLPVTRQQVKEWLMSQDAYTRHKPIRKNFKRNKVLTNGIDDLWQIDLADVQNISRFNRYLLTCIDVFSKYAWVIPLKNKKADTVLEAFKQIILSSERKPNKVQFDKGTEFVNSKFKNYFWENEIQFYSVNSELKASVVERFNRTIKEKMYRYFTLKNTLSYFNILEQIVNSYNHNFHRSIKMSPSDVNKDNEKQVYENLYGDHKLSSHKFNFEIGDLVRISKLKNVFEKGYTPNWTEELFTIYVQIPRNPVVYRIKDLNGEVIEGVFYEKELQKVFKKNDASYNIDKVLKKRKLKGVQQFFVSWKGYPSSFNSWISEKDFSNFKKKKKID